MSEGRQHSWFRPFQRLRERRAAKLGDGFHDLYDLYRRGLVLAEGTGQSITQVYATITNRTGSEIGVLVSRGTYFVSRGNHQNMVTREEERAILSPYDYEYLRISATCINAGMPIPTDKDRFRGVARVSPKVKRFLDAAAGEGSEVIQAGVWALTDNYSKDAIQNKLRKRKPHKRTAMDEIMERNSPSVTTGGHTFKFMAPVFDDDGPAISDRDIARAKAILEELGIKSRL